MKSAQLGRIDKIPGRTLDILLTEVEVQLANRTERYQLPLGISWDGDTNSPLPQQLALARVRQRRRMGYLTDAFAVDAFPLGLIRALRARTVVQRRRGRGALHAHRPSSTPRNCRRILKSAGSRPNNPIAR